MTDQSGDAPIIEQEWRGGVTVIDIGDLRISRGLTRRPKTSCSHAKLVYCQNERRIWCKDCESTIDPFDAFLLLVERYSSAVDGLNRRQKQLNEAEVFQIRSLAAKRIDEAWRAKNTVPMCPHCRNGLFPEDFKNGCASIGKEFAKARTQKITP